jgi:hypothetical protein
MRFGMAALVLAFMFAAAAVEAGTPTYECHFWYTWWNTKLHLGSGLIVGDRFVVPLREAVTSHTMKADDYWPRVVVGTVEIVYDYYKDQPARPYSLRASVMIPGAEDEDWRYSANAAQAEVSVEGKWAQLTASKNVVDGDLVHTFRLTCEPEWAGRRGRRRR